METMELYVDGSKVETVVSSQSCDWTHQVTWTRTRSCHV